MSSDQLIWGFSCSSYTKPGVKPACLQLQEHHGWNIPLLFYCCWAGLRYGALTPDELQQAKQFAESFSIQTVKPLRSMRQGMKSDFSPNWPVSEADWDQLREQVKVVELEAEKQLMQGLAYKLQSHPLRFGDLNEVLANIKGCFSIVDVRALATNLAIVLRAIFPDHNFQELGEAINRKV